MVPEQLMSELAWLRRLAAALVRDAADADDLVQDTWLVAAEHAPRDGRPVKPWLSRVALNLVRMRGRSAKRREAPTPDELIGRVEAQRIVVDEVLRLAEPYRSTLLLHYFEELPCAEIARRLGIPDGTVRRRLKAGLDELRGRLRAEERTTGRCVLAALAPLAMGRSATTALGIVAMKKIIAVVVVVIGLLIAASQLHRASPPAPVQPAVASAPVVAAPPIAREATTAQVVVAVTDPAGPVSATVRCASAEGEVVIAQAHGTATIELAAGTWSIAASAAGHEPAATSVDVVAGHDARVALVLASGGRILSGTVTDATGGAIAGARIDAARLDASTRPGRAVAVAFTDHDGHYKLAIGAGQLFVAASHPEYAPQTRYVDLGASDASASFALVPGSAIEGVVRDAQTKQPVPGAAVRARQDAAAMELAESSERVVKADLDGKFRIAGLRPGAYELSARLASRATRAPVRVGLGVAEQQAGIDVLVGVTATIRGKVLDEAGPVVGVTVVARNDHGDDGSAVSGEGGAFVLEGLAPSRWMLTGKSERHIAAGGTPVELVARDIDGVVVRVRRGLELRGHVEPRAACDVMLTKDQPDVMTRNETVTTEDSGDFRFTPLGAGSAKLTARCPSGDEGRVDVVIDGAEHVVRVAPGGSIAGRVVDTTGAPVVGVAVTAEAAGDGAMMFTTVVNGAVTSGFKAVTSTGGAFEIRGLAAARYRLTVLDRGRPMKAKQRTTHTLAAGQHATGVEIVVERPGGAIRGTVLGPDGAPIADAWVTLRQTLMDQVDAIGGDDNEQRGVFVQSDGGADSLAPALSDAHGRFELSNVPVGRYQVFAEAQGGKLRGRAADVRTGTDVTIRLTGVSSLRGTVRGARGPVELFSVELTGPTADVRSFTDGAFSFPRVEPGDYAADVVSRDGTGKATVHVAPGADADVEIVLTANATVTGRIVDKAGAPVSGMAVALAADQEPGKINFQLREQPLTTGPDGRFSLEGEAGTRMLVVLARKFTVRNGLVLVPGKTLDVGDVPVDE